MWVILIHLIIIFCIAYFLQWKFFKETENKIKAFGEIFPTNSQTYNIKSFLIDKVVLEHRQNSYILKNIYELNKENEEGTEKVSLIDSDESHSISFAQIRTALNTYLLRNKGSVADFHLIKDVVERYVDTRENEINASTASPLYYGLFGTMVSIVIGLGGFVFQIEDIANSTSGVKDILYSALFGMVASAFGLGLTVYNSHKLKDCKVIIENRKNDFYNFIQTDLLPILTHNINTGFYQLQLNLQNFNNEFSHNIIELKGLMANNHQALKNQTETLELLKKININDFADANVRILESLRGSTQDLQSFAKYLAGLNEFLKLSNMLNYRVNELLDKTESLDTVATEISQNVRENRELTVFLRSHYTELDKRGQLIIDAVARTDEHMTKVVEHMKENLKEQNQEFITFSLEEIKLMKEALQGNQNSIKELDYLSKMYQSLNTLQSFLKDSNTKIQNALTQKTNDIERQNALIQKTNDMEKHLAKLVALQEKRGMTFFEWIKSKLQWVKSKSK